MIMDETALAESPCCWFNRKVGKFAFGGYASIAVDWRHGFSNGSCFDFPCSSADLVVSRHKVVEELRVQVLCLRFDIIARDCFDWSGELLVQSKYFLRR